MSTVANPGQQAYTSQNANLDFLLYLPDTYGIDPEIKWPLIVYLHDAELRGTTPDIIDVPVWAFHGGNDYMVPVEVEQGLVDALNACGGNAQITVKPNAVIPVETYENPALFDWFLSQSRK